MKWFPYESRAEAAERLRVLGRELPPPAKTIDDALRAIGVALDELDGPTEGLKHLAFALRQEFDDWRDLPTEGETMTTRDAMKFGATISETNAKNAERLAKPYTVMAIETHGAGEELGDFPTESGAKEFAESVAHSHYLGVAIRRNADDTYDFGDTDGFVSWPDADDVQLRPEPETY